MKVSGLDEIYRGVFLAYFSYGATGEGKTVEAQLVYGGNFSQIFKEDEDNGFSKQLDIGFDPDMFPTEIIPAVVEREFLDMKYLDWNDRFKSKFFEVFGFDVWLDFLNAISQGGFLTLMSKRHYNLS